MLGRSSGCRAVAVAEHLVDELSDEILREFADLVGVNPGLIGRFLDCLVELVARHEAQFFAQEELQELAGNHGVLFRSQRWPGLGHWFSPFVVGNDSVEMAGIEPASEDFRQELLQA